MMSSTVAPLFQPLQIGSTTIDNRITMSALTRNRAPGTVATDLMKEYYAQRARGGAGLIVTEGLLIARQGTEWEHAPGLWDRGQHVGPWKAIVDAVHAEGTKIYAQLWQLGRVSHPDAPQQKLSGEPVWAPSAVAARGGKFRFLEGQPGYVTPTELPDPRKIVEQYRHAAMLAKEAGFDGVEIHYAHGYLPTQFLDKTSNKRTDEWGGSVENRARFGLEVIKAAKSVWGNNVSIKLSPAGGGNDVGMTFEDTVETFTYLINEAEKLGLAYITLLRYNPIYDAVFDGKPRGTKHDVLATFRPVIKSTPVFLTSNVLPEEGAKLISEGKVDAISIGFNWIVHPDLAKRVKYGKPLENIIDVAHLYGGEGDDLSVGYTDYPEAKYD